MLKASDIMTDDVATIRGSETVAEAVKLMKFKNLRALIVTLRNNQDTYGILSRRRKITRYYSFPTILLR